VKKTLPESKDMQKDENRLGICQFNPSLPLPSFWNIQGFTQSETLNTCKLSLPFIRRATFQSWNSYLNNPQNLFSHPSLFDKFLLIFVQRNFQYLT